MDKRRTSRAAGDSCLCRKAFFVSVERLMNSRIMISVVSMPILGEEIRAPLLPERVA